MFIIENNQKITSAKIKSSKKTAKEELPSRKNSEAALWKAVIMQAVLDVMTNSERAADILAKKVANDWLNPKNANFIKVCSYAGLEPNWVIKKIRFAITNPRTWRRECDLKKHFLNKSKTK